MHGKMKNDYEKQGKNYLSQIKVLGRRNEF